MAFVFFYLARENVNVSSNKSNFQIRNILWRKCTYLVLFSLRTQKNVIYFDVRQLEVPKMAFHEKRRNQLFFVTAQAKIKMLLCNFILQLPVYSFTAYIRF